MNVLNRNVELINPPDYKTLLSNVEQAARNCYRSQDKITDNSAEGMIRGLLARHHDSPLEFADLEFMIVGDRSFLAQITRHRLVSFAVESQRYCLAGDTKLKTSNAHNTPTIEELYNNKINSKNGAWKRMKIKSLDENSGSFIYQNMEDIVFNGIKPCYEIKTRLGYTLVATQDHEIYTENGYKSLGELSVGDSIYVNGLEIDSKLLYRDKDWLYNQAVTLNKCYTEIAEEFGFNVSTVKKWARIFKLPNKGIGNRIGHVPWNKGLTESDPRVKKQGDALRKYHCGRLERHDGIKKFNNRTDYRYFIKDKCYICGGVNNLVVHHIDFNHDNNDKNNLITLCNKCHGQIHNFNLEILHSDIIISIKPMGDKKVYDITMCGDNHNFVANGVIVHNCSYDKDKFGNNVNFIVPCDITNDTYETWRASCLASESAYFVLLEQGAKPETARSVLPNCVATHIVCKMNMRELRHILELRLDTHAQSDIRDIAYKMLALVYDKYPVFVEDLVNKYGREYMKRKFKIETGKPFKFIPKSYLITEDGNTNKALNEICNKVAFMYNKNGSIAYDKGSCSEEFLDILVRSVINNVISIELPCQ